MGPAPEAAPAKPVLETPVAVKEGIKVPESILFDAESDVYLVSNVNGAPLDADNNGYISKVAPDGKLVELKWIESGKKGATLNAPKGMAVVGDTLYVADISFVRMFDKKSGEPKGKVGIVGATFLNDIAAAPDGTIYVSDSGLKAGKEGFDPTGSDAIFKVTPKGATKLIADKEQLGRPNGLLADDTGVWVVTFGSGELYHVTKDGKKERAQTLPIGSLDGIARLPDGSILISSWAGSSVMRGMPGGTFEALITDVKSPADIAFDTKRNALVIPLFQADTVNIQKIPALPALPVPPEPAAAPAPAPVGATPATPATPAAVAPAPTKPAANTTPTPPPKAGPPPAPAPAKGPPPAAAPAKPAAPPPAAAAPAPAAPPHQHSMAPTKPSQPAPPAAPAKPGPAVGMKPVAGPSPAAPK
jgi:sugar lactone lactonase YvrE